MTNPFSYREAWNPLSRLAAGSKLLFLLCSTTAAMAFSAPGLAFLLGWGLVLHGIARISLPETGRASLLIFGLASAAAIFRGIAPGDGRLFAAESLSGSAIYAARLLSVFFFARVFYASTLLSRLGDSLTLAFRKIAPGKYEGSVLSDPGLLVNLTLLFLPRVFDDLIRVREAADLRCYGQGRAKPLRTLAMLSTFVFVALKGGLRTAGALDARGYSGSRTIEAGKWGMVDWLVAAAGPLMLILGRAAGA